MAPTECHADSQLRVHGAAPPSTGSTKIASIGGSAPTATFMVPLCSLPLRSSCTPWSASPIRSPDPDESNAAVRTVQRHARHELPLPRHSACTISSCLCHVTLPARSGCPPLPSAHSTGYRSSRPSSCAARLDLRRAPSRRRLERPCGHPGSPGRALSRS